MQENDLESKGVPDASVEKSDVPHDSPVALGQPLEWIQGWRLLAITMGICIAIGMTQADSTIASTAIVAITNDLGHFETSSWVFTAYLLTYCGFPIILARISDIIGRKQVFVVSLIIFTIFSGACGASQTLLQLIMFRWIQGLGASGVLAIGTIYGFELRPPQQWPTYSAIISLAVALSLSLAPLIGAAFTQIGKWRWIFIINAPIGVVGILLLAIGMPKRLPREPSSYSFRDASWTHHLRKLDYVGVFGLLGASVLLTAALSQVGSGSSFSAASVVSLLVLAPIFFIFFVCWQWFSTEKGKALNITPILSWDLLKNRVFLGVLMNAFFSGAVLTISIVHIPQRYIVVNNLSSINAGVRLLPFAAVMALTSMIMAIVLSKSKIPIVYWFLIAGCMQVAGVTGLSQSSVDAKIKASQYGFQVLAGFGVGVFNVGLLIMTPRVVDQKYLAVANGAINQFRILGGSVGLAVVNCAASPGLRHRLLSTLPPSQVFMVLNRTEMIFKLPLDLQPVVRRIFGESYNLQMLILIGFAAANIPGTLLQWRKKALVLSQ